MSTGGDSRCLSQARLPGSHEHWKRCIREAGHSEERHVWLESFAVADGRPIVVVWRTPRDASPVVGEVALPPGNYVGW